MAQRYETYKDSGVQWLGEIPGHWGCVALAKVADVILGKMLQNEAKSNSDRLTPYLCAKDVHFGRIELSDLKQMYFSNSELNLYEVKRGDMLIVEGGAGAGNCAILDNYVQGVGIQNSIMIVRGKSTVENPYICYYLSNIVKKGYVNYITNVATIPHFTKEKVSRTIIPLPPLPEQQAIVSYLDDKCGKIDEWLGKKQKEVEHLQELKQRIIADAVTRGLNPDVKMKECGIFWIPQIPDGWSIRRLGHILRKENRERPINAELLVCTNKATVVKRGDSKMGLVADSEDVYQGVKHGDLLIHGMDTWHGAIAVSNYDGMCTPVVHVCTSNEIVEYIALYLRYMAMMKVFKLISNGVRQNTSDFRSWGKVAVIPCPIPPLSEQQAIVTYITDKTSKIDTLITNINKEIENIKEYKQRLISDVVTGQIKVC